MYVKELCRQKKRTGETIAEFEVDKLIVRLIGTYDKERSLEDIIFMMACRRYMDKIA